ncbi:MAG: inositol monophosphatase family protein [Acidobacteriota bacterium]
MEATALEAAEAGAAVLRRMFRSRDLGVDEKAANDFVTEADRASEREIVATLRHRGPSHRILGEEGGWIEPDRPVEHPVEWIVDPLDGTTNFVHGLPTFCVSIGARHRGVMMAAAIVAPIGGDRWTARRGGGTRWNGRPTQVSSRGGLDGACLATGFPFRAHAAIDLYLEMFRAAFLRARAMRRLGAAALDLAYTACGVYDGFFELRLSPWDVAAGWLLVEEAGGVVTDLDGGARLLETGNVLAGSPAVHADLRAVFGDRVDENAMARAEPRGPVGALPASME